MQAGLAHSPVPDEQQSVARPVPRGREGGLNRLKQLPAIEQVQAPRVL
jgi:hypothetical protein